MVLKVHFISTFFYQFQIFYLLQFYNGFVYYWCGAIFIFIHLFESFLRGTLDYFTSTTNILYPNGRNTLPKSPVIWLVIKQKQLHSLYY